MRQQSEQCGASKRVNRRTGGPILYFWILDCSGPQCADIRVREFIFTQIAFPHPLFPICNPGKHLCDKQERFKMPLMGFMTWVLLWAMNYYGRERCIVIHCYHHCALWKTFCHQCCSLKCHSLIMFWLSQKDYRMNSEPLKQKGKRKKSDPTYRFFLVFFFFSFFCALKPDILLIPSAWPCFCLFCILNLELA